MKELTKENAKAYANKLMFNIKDEELDVLVEEFKIMALQLEHLAQIEGISGVEPMTFPFINDEASFREDIISRRISQEDAFKNCKALIDNEVKVPKVVGVNE